MGPIETAVRAEVQGSSALAEIAYALAESLDLREGGASAARELRTLLGILKAERPTNGGWLDDLQRRARERNYVAQAS